MTDIRQNKVSASRFEMVAACEGQPQLERRLREQGLIGEEPRDEWAERGTRIHKAWETGDDSVLQDSTEHDDVQKLRNIAEETWNAWGVDKGATITSQPHKEGRLWLKDSDGNKLASGQYDQLHIAGNHALVIDGKTGWCRRLTPSQQSWQLRLLAVLVWLEYDGLETVRASFIKPKLRHGVDTVEYSIEDLMRSKNAIMQILWRSEQPDAKRTASDACYYCQCKPHCAEAKAFSLLPSVIVGLSTGDLPTKSEVKDKVAMLQAHDLRYIWQRSTVIRNILDAVNDKLKSLPPEELSQLGLTIGKGKRIDPIVNTEGAFKALEFVIPKSLWSCLKFSKTAIVDALKSEKCMSDKDARQWVRDNLDLFVEQKESDGSLEEISG